MTELTTGEGVPQSSSEITVATLQKAVVSAPATEPDRSARLCAIAAAAGTLSAIECESVLAFMKNVTGMSIGALRSEAAKSSRRGDDHLAHARKTIKAIGPENILFAESYLWRWEGTVWRRRDDIAVSQEVIATLSASNEKITNALVESVTGLIRKEAFRPDHRFNIGNPEVVNTLTGELELTARGWIQQPHRREHYRTTLVPVRYDPTAQAPLFWQFLYDVFRDDSDRDAKVAVVLALIGYTLMAHARHEKFVLLIGNGANGKSVLLRVIEALVGRDNVAGVKPSQFDNKWQRAHLHMKLANIVSELPEGKVIADDELKAIVSSEISTVERKNRDPFDMRAFATCWFGTNHMPHTRDFSDGLYRRAVIVPFNRQFGEHEQDEQLADKLIAELPGILNLALHYYAHASRHGFTLPPSSIAAREEWRREADQVRSFIAERCEMDPAGEITLADLYLNFEIWARRSGVRNIVGKVQFGKRIRGQGFSSKHNDGTWITGLRWKPDIGTNGT
ncbi:phage/plasmid primase, P4 family [Altererythrobacter sp. MTPC7]|uniref:DNA primase family protein n=1 Tax=Altererythrobacter sp. MTPC7 TaxID=3056567 RepID=UPI0036F236D4